MFLCKIIKILLYFQRNHAFVLCPASSLITRFNFLYKSAQQRMFHVFTSLIPIFNLVARCQILHFQSTLCDVINPVLPSWTFAQTVSSELLGFCFSFFLIFFVSVPCARLRWPPSQLFSARNYTVSCRIVKRTPRGLTPVGHCRLERP